MIGRRWDESLKANPQDDPAIGRYPDCNVKNIFPWAHFRPCPKCDSPMKKGNRVINQHEREFRKYICTASMPAGVEQ